MGLRVCFEYLWLQSQDFVNQNSLLCYPFCNDATDIDVYFVCRFQVLQTVRTTKVGA